MGLKLAVVPVTPFQQNCSVLWCDETMKGAVVDPGGDLDRIRAAVDKHGVAVEKILLTHGHLDHAGATADLAADLGVKVEGPHREEKYLLDDLPEQSGRFGFPPMQAVTPDRWLADGDRVRVGKLDFEVIHCPGHTPGHVVYFHEPSRLAIVGDVLFQGSIGRTDFPRGNHEELIASIRKKLFPLGDDVAFVPGHGPISTFGDERRHNPFVSDLAAGEE